MIALLTPSESGYCSAFQRSSREVGGVVPRDVLEGIPLLGHGQMAVEQSGCRVGELCDDRVVLYGVYYETSHVLSFAVMHGYPAGIEGNLSLMVERQLLELGPGRRKAATSGVPGF